MIRHRHNIRNIRKRTVCGREILKAFIAENGAGFFQAVIRDINGNQYVSGSNNRDLARERQILREMLD